MLTSYLLRCFLFLPLGLCLACHSSSSKAGFDEALQLVDQAQEDLPAIRQRDTLRAITTYSSTSYFIYKGRAMGYEYDLLQRLASHLDLELEMVVAENINEMPEMLYRGEGDLIAHGLTVTKERRQYLAFTEPHNQTQQVLVQRLPKNWRRMKLHEIEQQLIRNPLDLIGKSVSVRAQSSYAKRLINLSEEMGDDILIDTLSGKLTTEEIIEMVAEGEVPYTVADQNIALINHTYYRNLDVKTAVSFPQYLAWAVRPNSPKLLRAVDAWLEEMQDETDYYVIYNKYFRNERAFRTRARSEFFSRRGNRISNYDEQLKAWADTLDWDWRLLASLVYQESQFDPQNRSWAGAQGLMQIMPATFRQYGSGDWRSPDDNLRAGTAFLADLQRQWAGIPDSSERVKFVLASYNAGPGHVADARRLAEKYKANPDLWDGNVAYYLKAKAKPAFFQDEVVRYGYCRGSEPFHYVQDILRRFQHYQRFIEEDAPIEETLPSTQALR